VGWRPETQPKGKPPVEKTKGAETMQRLIDADALKRDLVKNGFRNDVDMMMTLETINNAPTIDAVPHWIPCSERLPEKDGYYLTTTCYRQVYCDFWNEDHFDRTEAVIAWMPLPKPYEVDK
jgi:hypothetical protein